MVTHLKLFSLLLMLILPAQGQDKAGRFGTGKKTPSRELRISRVNIDVSYNCYKVTFKGSRKNTEAAVERIINELNRVWVPEAGLYYRLNNLRIREDKSTDPYQATRDSGTLFGIGRKANLQPACDVIMILNQGTNFGGGLGGGGCVWINWTGDMWDVMHHEFSHAYGPGHGVGWPWERGTQNLASNGSPYPTPRHHTLNFMELVQIEKASEKFSNKTDLEEEVSPYAHFDKLTVRKQPRIEGGKIVGYEIMLNPLKNDYDFNSGQIFLKDFDRKSLRGGTLSRYSKKSRPDRLLYKLDSEFADFLDYDYLDYTIVDDSGLESKGGILLLFERANNLVKNGYFNEGRDENWKMENAKVVPNGEAPTSVMIDHRALIQPGGFIEQEVELRTELSKKYELSGMFFTDREHWNSSKPKARLGIIMDGKPRFKTVGEREEMGRLNFKIGGLGSKITVKVINDGKAPIRCGHLVLRPVE